ncbi:uncharacterized protein LOC142328931 isoform X2 [Lycorma delicatula]|uniref:uncharacterized protein LOC142328931 isoform X2 n=1 Tax=Lycorma delicatula TaxID=130591 RepID=UPI003F512CAC
MEERIDGVSFALDFQKQITVELALLNEKLSSQLRDEISRSLYIGNDISKEERDIVQKLGNVKNLYKQQAAQVVATPESDVYLTPQASPSEQRCSSLHSRCLSDSLIDELQTPKGNLCRNNALYYSLVPVDEVFDSDCSGVLEKELAEQDELLESFKSIISKERKTVKTKKRNKPTSLPLTLSSSHVPPKQSNINNSVQKIYSKRKQDFDTKNSNKVNNNNNNNSNSNNTNNNLNNSHFVEEFNKHYNKNSSLQESCTFPPVSFKQFDCNVISDFNNSGCDGLQNRMSSCTNKNPKVESCVKESDDVMSNPETDIIGQDSVLDAGSSGYMTGSSPRDHTVSETFGVDVTEAASSEDIPHDNDRSVASSSVSSDAGTWDSTFPATMEEELTPNVPCKSNSCDLLKEGNNNSNGKIEQKNFFNQHNPTTNVAASTKNGSNLPDLVQVDCLENENLDLFKRTSTQNNGHNCTSNKSSTIINPEQKSKEKESTSVLSSQNIINNDDVSKNDAGISNCKASNFIPVCHRDSLEACNDDVIVDNKNIIPKKKLSPDKISSDSFNINGNENKSSSSKNNFFIDASSLLDENELLPPPKITNKNNDEYLFEKIISGNIVSNNSQIKTGKQCIDKQENIECSSLNKEEQQKEEKIERKYDNVINNCDELNDDRTKDLNLNLQDDNTNKKINVGNHDLLSPELSITSEGENELCVKKSKSENLSFEERRASLIRRNTFELEPDDEKLAILRQEYERRQGNQLFNDSPNNCNDNHYDKDDYDTNYDDRNNFESLTSCKEDNISPKKQPPPDSLFLIPKNLHLNDEDMHSPDSLNNDNPGDIIFEEKISAIKETDKRNEDSKSVHIQDIEDEISRTSLGSSSSHEINQTKEQINNRNLTGNKDDKIDERNSTSLSSCSKFDSNSQDGNNSYVGSTDRLNKIECMPIVSGGASINDFSPPVSCSSPLMSRRKTELAPILSGGAVSIPEAEPKPKPKANPVFTASWVVDMSDAVKSPEMRKKRADSARSSNSSEHSDLKDESTNKSEQKNVMRTSNPALGFFIPLDDPKPNEKNCRGNNSSSNNLAQIKSTPLSSESACESKTSSQNNLHSSSCGFYVDLNKSNDQFETFKEKSIEKNSILPDKKLFSMFIDISESSSTKSTENGSPKSKTSSPNLFSNKKVKAKTHTNRFFSKHIEEPRPSYDSQLSSESSIELSEHPEVSKGKQLFCDNSLSTPPPSRQISTNDNSTTDLTESRKKGGFFMFIEAESSSPVPRRRTLPSGLRPNFQRHSWNLESRNLQSTEDEINHKKEHKRAHSVSVDKSLLFNVNPDEKKSSSVASLSKNSSKEFSSGVFESGPASMDETVIRFSEKSSRAMISSWHGPVKPSFELQKVIARGERKDIKESKTILGLSKAVENHKIINRESSVNLINNSENSISCRSDETFDVSNFSDISSHKEPNDATFIVNDVSNVANATSNALDLSTPSHDIISELSKDDSEPVETDLIHTAESYSDLSKNNAIKKDITCIIESPRTPDHSSSQPLKTVNEEVKSSFVKLSDLDKEPAKLVIEERKTVNRMSRSIPETSWIESKMMTRSATSRSLSRIFPHLNIHTPENDDQTTDVSDNMSSMQSSMEPSALEGSTEETDASSSLSGPCSRLGEDLLRMFLDEISPDVTVEVGGRRIKAHKCILSSRCQYFAAMLSGGWVESAGNVISLQGFSYNAVHFALCHIYSGASNIPDSINIVELATLADMLCLEGLKEVIMYTLKVKYCHFFHKPCQMCTVGVLECLPLAAAYGLDEIYRKSLRWITKYFVRVWPTKGFAQLPRELIDKCFKQHIVHMGVENVLETVICCEKLQATIPQVRWADPVFALTHKLLETSIKYITQHFSGVLSSEMFLSLGKDSSWNLDRLEETLVGTTDRLSPDQACRSHSRLHTILTVAESADPPPEMTWSPEFIAMLRRIAGGVENSLIKQAGRAARTPAWAQMEPQLRHRIQDAACLIIIPGDDRRRARHSSLLRRSEGGSSGLRSSDLHQVKVAMTQQNVGKKTPSTTNTATTNTTVVANRTSLPNQASKPATKTDEKTSKTKSWPYKLAEVKSRYLEQRTPVKTAAATNNIKEKTCSSVPAQRKNPPGKPIISSSDSSRTSSPAMRRSVGQRTGRTLLKDIPKKESEGLNMSTDSLVENIPSRPSTSGKIKSKNFNEYNEINGNVRTPILGEKTRRTLPNKIDGIKMKSAESLTKVNGETKPLKSNSVSGSQNILGKEISNNKLKTSPVPLSKKTSSQGSPRVKESPVISRAKPIVNSTPSPALRRNNIISSTNSQQMSNKSNQDNKANTTIKRTSTYRVQNRQTSSPTKTSTPAKTREPLATTSNNRGNINNSRIQKSVNNNASSPVINRVKQQQQQPQLTVGSRSGTFLKDEPTVMRKIQTTNVD